MGQLKYETLIQKLENQGAEPYAYSGRFMYGDRCVAVNMKYMGQYDLPKGFSMDNMGMGFVAYWRGYPWRD